MSSPETAASTPVVQVQRLKDLLQCQEKSVVSRMLLKNPAGNVTLFAFDQGEGLSEHTAPYEALLVGVEGHADVRVGTTIHRLGEGESLLIPAREPHAVHPVTPFKMLLVMVKGDKVLVA